MDFLWDTSILVHYIVSIWEKMTFGLLQLRM